MTTLVEEPQRSQFLPMPPTPFGVGAAVSKVEYCTPEPSRRYVGKHRKAGKR